MDLREQHLIEWATQIAKAAYLIGYAAGSEGNVNDANLAVLIDQISGQNDTQPQKEK